MSKTTALLLSMRPEHWVKNAFVFTALIFSGSFVKPDRYAPALLTFAAFCLGASAAYLLNDVIDRRQDQLHPIKRLRPIAAGQLGKWIAALAAMLLLAAAVALATSVNAPTQHALLAYCVLTLTYSLFLKRLPILDIAAIAFGFVLRAYAGAVAIRVFPSLWLIGCSFLLAAFLALCKRLHELDLLGEQSNEHRQTLGFYTRKNLIAMIAACAGFTIAMYAYYTVQPSTVRQVKGPALALTLPFVVYGICRYLHLVFRHDAGGRPVLTFFTDWRLLATVTIWAATSGMIIYLKL